MSTMLLEKNGRKLITKKTKRIQVQYFFIKDQVLTVDVDPKHCLTTKYVSVSFHQSILGRTIPEVQRGAGEYTRGHWYDRDGMGRELSGKGEVM